MFSGLLGRFADGGGSADAATIGDSNDAKAPAAAAATSPPRRRVQPVVDTTVDPLSSAQMPRLPRPPATLAPPGEQALLTKIHYRAEAWFESTGNAAKFRLPVPRLVADKRWAMFVSRVDVTAVYCHEAPFGTALYLALDAHGCSGATTVATATPGMDDVALACALPTAPCSEPAVNTVVFGCKPSVALKSLQLMRQLSDVDTITPLFADVQYTDDGIARSLPASPLACRLIEEAWPRTSTMPTRTQIDEMCHRHDTESLPDLRRGFLFPHQIDGTVFIYKRPGTADDARCSGRVVFTIEVSY